MFIGAKAVAQGMADRVGTFDAVLAEMQTASMSGQTKPKRKGMKMSGENEPTLSAEEVLTQHPSAVAEIQQKAADAERERIMAIEAVKAPGYDNVIAENKFKPGMTADKMSALILAAQNDKATAAADKVKTDAEKLAQQSAGTGGDAGGADRETTEALERANAVKNMAAGIDSKRSN
jgi:hypothetical protein